ncbi:hypothetical protein [Streptosporangium sp. NPDC087985]|uniref:hypothetical protein n=1 Tax=Streptosporangium sp. NPDC087985 TaxID=3366196 RepID=UPI003820C9A4
MVLAEGGGLGGRLDPDALGDQDGQGVVDVVEVAVHPLRLIGTCEKFGPPSLSRFKIYFGKINSFDRLGSRSSSLRILYGLHPGG